VDGCKAQALHAHTYGGIGLGSPWLNAVSQSPLHSLDSLTPNLGDQSVEGHFDAFPLSAVTLTATPTLPRWQTKPPSVWPLLGNLHLGV
jgi:hypothetical protein